MVSGDKVSPTPPSPSVRSVPSLWPSIAEDLHKIVHCVVQLPPDVHFLLPFQREPDQPQRVSDVAEHRPADAPTPQTTNGAQEVSSGSPADRGLVSREPTQDREGILRPIEREAPWTLQLLRGEREWAEVEEFLPTNAVVCVAVVAAAQF